MRATSAGTARYAARFPAYGEAGFYRIAQGLHVPSLGIGTYLGQPDEATDRAYTGAVRAAIESGINFLDTAINYRQQRSERAIGTALAGAARDEMVVCTKAGFLTPGAVPGTLAAEDVAGGMHSMAPDFLADQIDRSRANLAIEAIDVFYLHNPETQLGFVGRDVFEERIRRAFARLEQLAEAGRIGWYGTATWDGYRRPDALDLNRLLEIARQEGGDRHRFRFIQLPLNLAMVEALERRPESPLEIAARAGMTVVASASLLQTRLARDLPEEIAARLPGLRTDAQRAIQFTRSTPGVSVALVGMSQAAHVAENLEIAPVPPATPEQYQRLFA